MRAAIGPRAAAPVVAGSALIAGALVAAVVFGSSLSNLVDSPRAYGWPWDLAAMRGFGYGGLDLEGAHELLDGDPAVETWTALGFLNEISLDGQPMMAMVAPDVEADLELSLLAGSIPDASDEIAVGAITAEQLGVSVGDSVELAGGGSPSTVTVSGVVVFPSLGQFAADRVGAGTGVLLPSALLDADDRQFLATFVGVDLRDDADPEAIDRLATQLGPLDLSGFEAGVGGDTYRTPVRPPELIELRSTQAIPVIVVVVLTVMATAGLLFASWASVRARRRELAVLRSLGFTGAQVRRSVRVQSVATVAAALVVGVPFGVIAGRLLWRGFADQLGVVPDPAGAWLPLLLVIVGGLLVAVAVAQVPAVLAARRRPSEGLRAE
ncbi:hypothetical protein BH18ACT2_BH18ACT2_00150 [soil metagenome]